MDLSQGHLQESGQTEDRVCWEGRATAPKQHCCQSPGQTMGWSCVDTGAMASDKWVQRQALRSEAGGQAEGTAKGPEGAVVEGMKDWPRRCAEEQ